MAYASRAGRARTSASNPQAHAICDRCGFRYNFVDLNWQYEWRGATLQNIKILVCKDCLDVPQENIRSIVIPADPTPIVNARVQDFAAAETDDLTISRHTVTDPKTGIPIPPPTTIVTQDCRNITTQPIGPPTGLDPNAVMPQEGRKHYRLPVPFISITANGTDQISVTCYAPHKLITGDQVAFEGLTSTEACGIFTIKVATATLFTYQVNVAIPAGSLLTSAALVY